VITFLGLVIQQFSLISLRSHYYDRIIDTFPPLGATCNFIDGLARNLRIYDGQRDFGGRGSSLQLRDALKIDMNYG
jgi:hypothetical protein